MGTSPRSLDAIQRDEPLTHGDESRLTVPANIGAVTGVHDVYLTFTSGQPADFVNLNWFTFGH